ncbi:branched-subunit amino acid aminotransferase/4-amino-4-deoxychorismate lyase [Salinibacterium sp. CAN_S4]|uniref:aminotransferase class IV n=1 Tax=Salinibacterium sp. CAN_S4 TaxID=2787727 RepID=UPI0018F03116
MSVTSISRWHEDALVPLEYCDMIDTSMVAADSWFVSDGRALAIGLHRERFLENAPEAESFWDASIAAIPSQGDWFPRVEKHANGRLLFRLRTAPERQRAAVLATWTGPDPRTRPSVKGPDLDAMLRIRTAVQPLGASEAVILSEDGFVVEGAYSGLLWWRGDILCGPPADLARVNSVTSRSALTLAAALGLDTHEEAVTPEELDGTELWALSALHGIRIATAWVDGPELAEQPGRLATWRARLDALRREI